ncbi:hypothetical protein RFI_24127, partial [Reticulomyxa filosa]
MQELDEMAHKDKTSSSSPNKSNETKAQNVLSHARNRSMEVLMTNLMHANEEQGSGLVEDIQKLHEPKKDEEEKHDKKTNEKSVQPPQIRHFF